LHLVSTIQREANAMAEDVSAPSIAISETSLRDLARNASKILPDFAEKDPAIGVK
jgi:hypothetical protein